MSKLLVVLFALLAFASANLLRTHDYWYTAQKTLVKTGAPMADTAWNYCDVKCLYLEKLSPANDFVFIGFTESVFKPNFGACYAVKNVGGKKTYELWNKVVTNAWYEEFCGKETEDYYALTQGASPKYKLDGTIQGEGKGVEADY
jgi:hypothetical protein